MYLREVLVEGAGGISWVKEEFRDPQEGHIGENWGHDDVQWPPGARTLT